VAPARALNTPGAVAHHFHTTEAEMDATSVALREVVMDGETRRLLVALARRARMSPTVFFNKVLKEAEEEVPADAAREA
jgi:hypothetical protein